MMTPGRSRAILGAVRSYREDEWAEIRAGGKAAFLFKTAVLGRGLPLGIVTSLAIEVYLRTPLPDGLLEPPFLGRLLFAIAVFSATGGIAANASWSLHERRFGGKG